MFGEVGGREDQINTTDGFTSANTVRLHSTTVPVWWRDKESAVDAYKLASGKRPLGIKFLLWF